MAWVDIISLGTVYIPSVSLLGSHSFTAGMLVAVLAVAARMHRRRGQGIATLAPVILMLAAVGLAWCWGKFIGAQHYVGQFICIAGIVGFSMYCVRRCDGLRRLWGGLLLVLGTLMVAHVAAGILISGWLYPGRYELMGLMLGALLVAAVTWLFWRCWASVARVRAQASERYRLGWFPVLVVCVFWAGIGLAGALNLANRWSKQAPALRLMNEHGGIHARFGKACGLEFFFPPPVKTLKPLHELSVSRSDVSDTYLAAVSRADSLRELRFSDARHVTDDGLQHLTKLRNLEVLNMRHLRVSSEAVRKLKAALPGVRFYLD